MYDDVKRHEDWPAPSAVAHQLDRSGLHRWPGIPRGLPTLVWPTADLNGFLALAEAAGVTIVYTEGLPTDEDSHTDSEPIIGWAHHGVLHVFGDLIGDIDDDDLEDDDEFEPGLVRLAVRAQYNGVDLGSRDEYWDWNSGQNAPTHLRPVIDAVVADPDYDDWDRDSQHDVIERHAGHLSGEEYELVSNVASSRFRDSVGKDLVREVDALARELAKHPDAPLWEWGDAINSWVGEVRPDISGRTCRRVARELPQRLSSRREDAERLLRSNAKEILATMSTLARDELGFTKKRIDRTELLGQKLEVVDPGLRQRLADAVATLEEHEFGRDRERRYATVGRILLTQDTKAGTARALGISTAVLDRLVSAHKRDVPIEPDDPLRTHLRG